MTSQRKPVRKLNRSRRTTEELITEMGLKPEKLQKIPIDEISRDELKQLIKDAIAETPIPAEARKSVLLHVYDAMTVIVTAHGLWTFLKALMEFASSLVMSAAEPPQRDATQETSLAQAQKLIETVDPSTDALTITQTLRLHIEAAIQEGAVESGLRPATAESMATTLGLQIQRRLFLPDRKIDLDPRTSEMLTSLWQLMEQDPR